MDVPIIGNSYDPAFIRQAAGESLGKEEFLRLLVTQLRYQDPLSPIDNTEFVAQLAQFSSLEQMQNMNSRFDEQNLLIQSLNNSMAAALVGRGVVIASDTFKVSDGELPRAGFLLADHAETVTVDIVDAGGALVRTLEMQNLDAERHEIGWDGLDSLGREVPEGEYSFTVTARDAADGVVSTLPVVVGTVESVVYENGTAFFSVGGRLVLIGALIEVLGVASTPGDGPDGSSGDDNSSAAAGGGHDDSEDQG